MPNRRGPKVGKCEMSSEPQGSCPRSLAPLPQVESSFLVSLGEDSHRIVRPAMPHPGHKLLLGGYLLPLSDPIYVQANSDGDVILHALIRALTGLSGQAYLGTPLIEKPVQAGERDSRKLFHLAWDQCQKDFAQRGQKIFLRHISISLEAKRPKIAPHALAIRQNLAGLTGLRVEDIGLTAMTGEGLTACGRGEGIRSLVIVTAQTQPRTPK